MRLPKRVYSYSEVYVGDDWRGVPIYEEEIDSSSPIAVEIEPYSSKLAETTYGVFVEVTHRIFCKPNEKMKIGEVLFYQNEEYQITSVLEYDRHFEVLIKKVGT